MRWVRRLLGAAVVVATMVAGWRFAAENQARVPISYVWGVVELPLWQGLLWFFAVGFVLAAALGLWFALRARIVQRRYRKAVHGLEAEIHQLRNLSLAPDAGSDSLEKPLARAGQKDG
jgi:uncharacterized membrane protein YciS (DUF1049 family)